MASIRDLKMNQIKHLYYDAYRTGKIHFENGVPFVKNVPPNPDFLKRYIEGATPETNNYFFIRTAVRTKAPKKYKKRSEMSLPWRTFFEDCYKAKKKELPENKILLRLPKELEDQLKIQIANKEEHWTIKDGELIRVAVEENRNTIRTEKARQAKAEAKAEAPPKRTAFWEQRRTPTKPLEAADERKAAPKRNFDDTQPEAAKPVAKKASVEIDLSKIDAVLKLLGLEKEIYKKIKTTLALDHNWLGERHVARILTDDQVILICLLRMRDITTPLNLGAKYASDIDAAIKHLLPLVETTYQDWMTRPAAIEAADFFFSTAVRYEAPDTAPAGTTPTFVAG